MFHYSLRVIDEPKNERNSNFELVPQKVDFGRYLQTFALKEQFSLSIALTSSLNSTCFINTDRTSRSYGHFLFVLTGFDCTIMDKNRQISILKQETIYTTVF